MGLWAKLAKHSERARVPRGISRAALDGATLDDLCQETFLALQHVLHGRAVRFAVWLSRGFECGEPSAADSFQGRFWNDGRESDSSVWEAIGTNLPFPKSLMDGASTLQLALRPTQAGIRTDAATDMRHALWVPIRVKNQLAGVLFAATRNSSARFPREEIERAAAELALVLELRSQAALAQARAIDLAETRKIWLQISAGASLDRILQEIANASVHPAANRTRAPRFAALGILSDSAPQRSSANPPLSFRWSAGDKVLVRLASAEPISTVWRKALETGTTVGSALPVRCSHGDRSYSETSRVVAIPLLISGDAKGVLVAGYHGLSATLSDLERLELRAGLAAAALAMSTRTAGSFADASNFLIRKSSDPIFFLNFRREIIGASNSAKALLPSHGDTPLRRTTSIRRDDHPIATAAQIFRPAEWPRVSAWMDVIAESASHRSAHSIATELYTGHAVQLHAAPLTGGGLALVLEQLIAKEDPAILRATTELHNLIEWIDQGVLLFDENENLRAINQRFSQLFGFTSDELRNATGLRALVALAASHVSDPTQFAARWWDASRGVEASLREEVHVLQPSTRILERISRPVLDSAGVRLGRIEIYRDLTSQQLFQSKLHKSERLAVLGQKLSGVAHELSNPLTTILGYAQRLLHKSGDSAHRDDIHRIFSEADRASSILRQLLGSSREAPSERHPIDVNPLILRTVDPQRFQVASEKIRLALDLAPSLPPVLCNSGQLQQILVNLISNSRYALLDKPGAVISVRTRIADSGRVIVEVSDSGPGIPEADRHRIFDPFFTTKPAGIGTGLGLSIVMSLVRQNGGNIKVQSAVGQGATFSIDLPAANALLAVHTPDLLPALSSPAAVPSGRRVLVVEDEPTVAQLISDMLSDLGYASDVLHDGRRALVSALNREYDLIICDMKMSGLDGRHFYRALAEAGKPLAAKFIFVTGDVLGVNTQEFLCTHDLPYIAKPFRLEEFAEKITFVLGQVAAAAPTTRLPTGVSFKNLRSHG
jgi:signal transduction histidine kinase/CheY-like chemotaxis protein